MEAKQKVYFKNLNTIRFLAAFLVIIDHIEGYKNVFGQPNIFNSVILFGELGVVLFFVLSGFLITYLMLAEEKYTSTVSIKDFYIRRILRIWPLYFLIVILAFFILPHLKMFTTPNEGLDSLYPNIIVQVLLLVFFLPNLLAPIYGLLPGTNQLWSIGVEEQFYLFWPILFKSVRKHRFLAFSGVISIYIFIRFALYHLPSFTHQKIIIQFWERCNIDCMAIGGIFALIHFTRKDFLLQILYKPWIQWSTLLIVSFCLFNNIRISETYYFEIFAVLFGILILNFATNPRPIFNLENRLLNYLGKISYGIYMYHMLAILFSINLLLHLNIYSNWILYPFVILLTFGIAAFSYKYFEEWFIKAKMRYSKVISGESAKGLTATMACEKATIEEDRA